MRRVVDAVLAAWRARVPAPVGVPPGGRRRLLPAWPFAVLGAYVLLNAVAGLGAGWLNWVGALPAFGARRHPAAAVAGCVVVNLGVLGVLLLDDQPGLLGWQLLSGPLQLLTAYAVALAMAPRAAAVANGALALSGAAVLQAAGNLIGWFAFVMWVAVVAVVGLLGARRAANQALMLRTIAEDEQRRAVDERARIARELHDVVAHHMSAMAVRAASAPHRLGELPAPARDEFTALAAEAREALGEMRQLLGVLRGADGTDLTPQPGLADVPVVVERTRRAGTPVEVELDPALAPSPPTGVSVYRVVQESLSNVTRHATGAPTRVRIVRSGDGVLVEVRNAAPAQRPQPHPAQPGTPGHGLAGMRERVQLLGGHLDAGPTPDGGFGVRAVLPDGPAR